MIKSRNMCKSFCNDRILVNAVIDCNVEIEQGECVKIVGAKGSGKTTLLRLLCGIERPSSGTIYIDQDDIASLSDDKLAILRRNVIGYLFQNDSLIPELTVHENIIMPTILSRKKYEEDYYEDLLKQLHLSGILKRYPKQLTMNQVLCVTYARALIHKPNIILIDEPTDQHCQHRSKEVLEFLLNMVHRYRKTLIMVTQDPMIGNYADHIIRLNQGIIIEDRIICN